MREQYAFGIRVHKHRYDLSSTITETKTINRMVETVLNIFMLLITLSLIGFAYRTGVQTAIFGWIVPPCIFFALNSARDLYVFRSGSIDWALLGSKDKICFHIPVTEYHKLKDLLSTSAKDIL